MDSNVHDVYDVILKLIILVYSVDFLKYIGITKDIKEILKTEFTRLDGKKFFLDFLCRLEDDTLCHIEFQFPKARLDELNRFFDYNIIAQVTHGKITETVVLNFTRKKASDEMISIGKTKKFLPMIVYMGDIDFETKLE